MKRDEREVLRFASYLPESRGNFKIAITPVISFFPHQCKSIAYAFCRVILMTRISPHYTYLILSYVGLCDYSSLPELFSAEDAYGSVTKLNPTRITLLPHIWFFVSKWQDAFVYISFIWQSCSVNVTATARREHFLCW